MASRMSRRLWVLGRPCPLGVGRGGSMYFHSASDRSVGYLFLIPAKVAKYRPRTPFHTVSPGTSVNKLIMHLASQLPRSNSFRGCIETYKLVYSG